MEILRLFDLLDQRQQQMPGRPVFSNKKDGKWEDHYIDEYIEKANLVSYALLQLGVKRGENVALISEGRPEWNYIDMGVQQIGAVLLPIYPTISENDYKYILSISEVRVLFLESGELLRKIRNIRPELPMLQHIYTISPCPTQESFNDLLALGRSHAAPQKVQAIKDSILTVDVATIIFTSGTTGLPKGVLLSHRAIIANINGIKSSPDPSWTRSLSFLPMCHIYERMMSYLYQWLNYNIFYAESIATVGADVQSCHPHMMAAVPRFLEKIYDKIYRKGENLKGAKRKLFFWAVDVALNYELDASNRSACYEIKRRVADLLVFRTIRQSLGGSLKMLVSGSASIQPKLVRFFSCVGLDLYEGYGMTECAPLVAVTNTEKNGRRIGSVGFALPGVDVRVDPQTSEIQCRGVNVMNGYYKEPELTAQSIDPDGWFHTGDTGYFDPDGYLFLTGRLNSMFKTSMGKYVNPEVIEEKFKESPFVLDMMVVGEGQKFAAALVVPDFDFLKGWCLRHGVKADTREEMVSNKAVLARYQRVLEKYNPHFGATEQVKRIRLLTEYWTLGNGMLTPTFKIRRKVIGRVCNAEIAALFA